MGTLKTPPATAVGQWSLGVLAGVVSPRVPSWNRIAAWLRDMEDLRRAIVVAGCVGALRALTGVT
jgi:hypothetical protein